VHSEPQESQPDDTISRVSLHVVGSGGIIGENLETSILHTTSGGGNIIRKQHQPVMSATFLPPHTIPLTYNTSEPPSTHRSIANPFTVPELPIMHQFHNVEAILKASPVKNAKPNMTWISQQRESFQADFTVNSKWMRNSSSDGNTDPRNPNLRTDSVSSGNQQWIELLNDTTSIVKPQHSSHRESFPARHHPQPAWVDTGNRARPGNSKISSKDTDIQLAVTSAESSLSRIQVNKSMRVQLATLNPLGDSMANTPFSIVTLIPVRSNSGVGRPLRPRPKLPSHISIQIKNKTEPIDVALNSEHTMRHNEGDIGQSSPSPTPVGSGPVSAEQQHEESHKRKTNLAASTNRSEGAIIKFNQASTEAPQQEIGSTVLDHKSQSSGFNYSTQSPIFTSITSSVSQQIPTLPPVTSSNIPLPSTTDTTLTSINVTQAEAVPTLPAATPVSTSSITKSASEKMTTMPTTKGTHLATSSTASPVTAITTPLRKTTQQPSTAVTTKEMKTLPPSSSTSTTKSAQTTAGTSPPSTTAFAPTATMRESSSATLASNTHHRSQMNKTATDQTKNGTHIIKNMVKISSVSTLKQRPSEREVQKNTTAGISNSSSIKIKETNRMNTSSTPSPHQKILTTKTPSLLTQTNNVTAPKNSHSTMHLSGQPATHHTTPSEFIPVIVIQDLPDETWHRNNSIKQTVKVKNSAPTVKVHSSASSVHDGVDGQREDITRNTTVIRNASRMQENSLIENSELRDNKNSSGNGKGQNIYVTIPKLQGGNNSSKQKPESVKENITNTTPQSNTATPQVVILNTDIVTTTSIEISFGENTGKVITRPLKTSQLPNITGITVTPNISSDRHNAENVTTVKQVDSNHSNTMDVPITLSSAVTEMTSTHKAKETRRQPKMKLTNTYAPSFKNFRLERMTDSVDNMEMKEEMYTDMLMPKVTDVVDTTKTFNIFSSEENVRKTTADVVTQSEPESYNYSLTSDEPGKVFEPNSTTQSSVSETYTSDQVPSVEEELDLVTKSSVPENYSSNKFPSTENIILSQTNASLHLTKEGSPQREEELPFTSSHSNVEQDPTLQRVHEGIIPTTQTTSPALFKDSTPNKILSTKDEITNIRDEALEIFTNFTVTKITASNSMQGKQPPEDFEMSDDDVMLLLNATRKNSFMSQEAVNTLSKYANIHTAISANNITKDSQNNIYNDKDKTSNETTENYVSEKIINIATEEEKLSTKGIMLHGSNNHAGIPILTKIYNKAPQQFSEKQATTEAGSTDVNNATGKWII
jgi:hypothetical protein